MTLEIAHTPIRRTDVTIRTAAEIEQDARDAARRADVGMKVTAVTLLWLVSVSLLLGFGLTTRDPDATNAAAALVAIVLPFVGAVIATRNRMPFLGGVYVVVTLATATLVVMIPALGIVWAAA